MAKAKRSAPKKTAPLGPRKGKPMPFKDVVQRLLETPPKPKKRSK